MKNILDLMRGHEPDINGRVKIRQGNGLSVEIYYVSPFENSTFLDILLVDDSNGNMIIEIIIINNNVFNILRSTFGPNNYSWYCGLTYDRINEDSGNRTKRIYKSSNIIRWIREPVS